jgi:integrase
MLWALMLTSGMRRGEVPLIRLNDVLEYRGDLWVQLRVRSETRHLGEAKTGGRIIFIGFDPRVRVAWDNWKFSRDVLVAKWMGRTNQPDHGMFLVNRNGSPLTRKGIESLMKELNSRFKTFGDYAWFGDEGFALHPHALRHTIKTLMEEWNVPAATIQRHLGHRNRQTTDQYGKTFRTTYVATMQRMESRFLAAASQATDGE